METGLSECQICGNERPVVKTIKIDNKKYDEHYVFCKMCETTGPLCINKQEAIDHWNNLHSYNNLKSAIKEAVRELNIIKVTMEPLQIAGKINKALNILQPHTKDSSPPETKYDKCPECGGKRFSGMRHELDCPIAKKFTGQDTKAECPNCGQPIEKTVNPDYTKCGCGVQSS